MLSLIKSHNKQKGFTLVELLVVMSILGVLVTLVAGGFRTAQLRGRDAQRKSDLRELANSLELFFSDYGVYPPGSSGQLEACPYTPSTGNGTTCTWGGDTFTDNKTTYFKEMPADPYSGGNYFYRIVPTGTQQQFQLFARLENPKDKDCINGDCLNSPVAYDCGSGVCNFAITSSNTSATE